MERKCTIILMPDNVKQQMDIQTGGVTNIEILDMIHALSQHFAREVIKDYQEITGDKDLDESKMEQYMMFLRNNKL